jgi:hypothetical protein
MGIDVSEKPAVSMFRIVHSSVKIEAAGFSQIFIPIH